MCSPSLSPERPNTQPAARLDLPRAFALKTTKEPYRLLDGDNHPCSGYLSLEQALASGQTFMGTVADDVLACDADTAVLAGRLLDLTQSLRAAGHHPIVIASGRPDHRHLFVRFHESSVLATWMSAAKHRGLDVRQKRRMIRPPLTPHRWGLAVSLVDPEDPAEALAALSPPRPGRLPPRIESLLRNGVPRGRRSEAIQTVAYAMAKAAWTFEGFATAIDTSPLHAKPQEHRDGPGYLTRAWNEAQRYGLVLDEARTSPAGSTVEDFIARVLATPLGDRVREKPDPAAYLRRAWAAAHGALPRVNPPLDLTPFRAAMQHERWRGKGGGTELAVLRAHLAIVERSGSLDHGAASREIAERAKIRHDTVKKRKSGVWDRLQRKGWLKRLPRGRTSRWRLMIPLRHRITHSAVSPRQVN